MFVMLPHLFAQQGTVISGRITDTDGQPVIGAAVVEEGASNGSVTDLDGKYSIRISGQKASLNISCIGYETRIVPVGGSIVLDIILGPDENFLEEAVVVGYGTQKNIEKIDSKNMLQYVIPEDIRKFGLIPEIVGRLPVLAYLNPLDREALRQILTEPKNSIVNQYIKLFKIDGIDIKFDDEALDYIVDQAISFKLGARGLRSICESIMLEAMFEMPSVNKKTFTVTKEYAESKLDRTAAIKFRNA